jgi:hypothetical protein
MLFSRVPYLFDLSTRIYLAKIRIRVINLYDITYGSASNSALRYLDVANNDLMRSVLRLCRSQHFRLADMYRLTSFDSLNARRFNSLKSSWGILRILDCSRIRMLFVRSGHSYESRTHNHYIVPVCRTKAGQQRVSVCGLKLLDTNADGWWW